MGKRLQAVLKSNNVVVEKKFLFAVNWGSNKKKLNWKL
jgi:hypothetical protein